MSWLSEAWPVLAGVLAGLLTIWVCLVALLWRASRGSGIDATEALRLLPDLLRLLRRLARDKSLPRGVRLRLWLALGYLVSPLDVVPDFIPVLGYADDAIIVTLVLRSIVRRAGPVGLEEHWPGTTRGLAAVRKLAGLPPAGTVGS